MKRNAQMHSKIQLIKQIFVIDISYSNYKENLLLNPSTLQYQVPPPHIKQTPSY
jgi:hypothetical protein